MVSHWVDILVRKRNESLSRWEKGKGIVVTEMLHFYSHLDTNSSGIRFWL